MIIQLPRGKWNAWHTTIKRRPYADDEHEDDGAAGGFAQLFEDEISDICEDADGFPATVANRMIADGVEALLREHGDGSVELSTVYGEDFDGCSRHRPTDRSVAMAVATSRKRTTARGLTTTLTSWQWAEILASHDNRCVYCGAFGRMQLDHLVPVSKGGGTTADNCVPACESCNMSKNNHDLLDWLHRSGISEIGLFDRLSEARRKRMEASQ